MKSMLFGSALGALLLLLPVRAQTPAAYLDPRAPLERRVDDLVSRMTLEEKVSQLMNDSVAIERLNVPAYNWWNEALHGVGRNGRATVFPQAIGMAATWDTDLMFRVATAISDEARAKYNEAARRGKHNIYQGLTFWTPNINLFRDPRWGRGMETYGEDPYLTGRFAVSFIKGMQGDDPKYFKTIATAKHFAVHSGPEPGRHTFDAVVPDRTLFETYLPHFEAAIKEGGAFSVMCAYNSVDGLPACANPVLLKDILRLRWGFKGYVVSDCAAIQDIYLNHKKQPGPEEGVAAAIKAGTDLNCGVEYNAAIAAVRNGKLTEADINQALRRLLTARFKLGIFDPPSQVKYSSISPNANDSAAHRELALETARKSIVLLKNEKKTLPLSKALKTVAVIGPNADDPQVALGNYNGIPSATVTTLAGIRKKLGGTRVLYARGSEIAANMPHFEVVPATALLTSMASDAKPGLNAEYYGSGNFDGTQHRPAELTYPSSGKRVGDIPVNIKPVFTRVDSQVDFHWWDGSPRADLNDDDFGARWTGYIKAPESGMYQIGGFGMNAFELYVDDKQIVRSNTIHEASYQYAAVPMDAGKLYKIQLDYHEYANDAGIQLVWSRPGTTKDGEAIAAATQADAVIMVLGLSPRLEGEEMKVPVEGFEGGDRVTIGIPQVQEDLLKKVVALGKPVVLVLLNGSAVAINWAKDNVPAIMEAWYPGEEGGTAIADVLFGDYNPGGRLPVTFYKSVDQLPSFTDYSMKEKTYRFFTGEPLFRFGHGLSYTTFAYSNLKAPDITIGQTLSVLIDVENTGNVAGEEVVQLYVEGNANDGPIRSLQGFSRVALRPKQRKTVEFKLKPEQIARVAVDGRRRLDAGRVSLTVGGLPITIRITGASKILD